LFIQYGTSMIYPPSVMGAHVSAVPNHQTGRVTPLETRAAVAMAGCFGYELDPERLTEAEKERIRAQIGRYRDLWDTVFRGKYYRLASPEEDVTVWESVSEDLGQALVTAVYGTVHGNMYVKRVRLRGLDPDAAYTLRVPEGAERLPAQARTLFTGGRTLLGQTLMNQGIYIPPAACDRQAWQIRLDRA
ncbi:MAG: alpha-galactosidase, partial [Lachnospiraceae bacterium]|nr:alpha-galactosidase [Lachnospiraceae bacterium]